MTKLSKSKIAKIDRKNVINLITLEHGLSDDAKHFLRCNPAAQDNILVMSALSYMDDCVQDAEDTISEAVEAEHDADLKQARQEVCEKFRTLVDAALYAAKEPDDDENLGDLYREARRLDKYMDNV